MWLPRPQPCGGRERGTSWREGVSRQSPSCLLAGIVSGLLPPRWAQLRCPRGGREPLSLLSPRSVGRLYRFLQGPSCGLRSLPCFHPHPSHGPACTQLPGHPPSLSSPRFLSCTPRYLCFSTLPATPQPASICPTPLLFFSLSPPSPKTLSSSLLWPPQVQCGVFLLMLPRTLVCQGFS